jgi:hypothetical protein
LISGAIKRQVLEPAGEQSPPQLLTALCRKPVNPAPYPRNRLHSGDITSPKSSTHSPLDRFSKDARQYVRNLGVFVDTAFLLAKHRCQA